MPSAAAAMSASSNTTTGALPPSSRWTRLRLFEAASATCMPARTEPGDRHHRRGVVIDHRPPGVAVAADHVEHAGRQELGGDLGEQPGGGRCRVARLQHHRSCRPRSPERTSRPPSSSGSSTVRPGRTPRPVRDGRTRSCWPCTRPPPCPRGCERRRRRSGSGRPSARSPRRGGRRTACRCSRTRAASARRPRLSIASAIRIRASDRSEGVDISPSPRTRRRRPHGRIDVGRTRQCRLGVLLAGRRVDDRRWCDRPSRRPTHR